MSWSVNRIGERAAVRAACDEDFQRAIKQYEGQEEANDINAARDRCMRAVDDTHPTYNGVSVNAYGSRSAYSVTLHVEVKGVALTVKEEKKPEPVAPPFVEPIDINPPPAPVRIAPEALDAPLVTTDEKSTTSEETKS